MPKILLIEDEPKQLKLRAALLQARGYQVAIASSGAVAVKLILEDYFDLVVTDYLMPAMTGIDLARQIKLITPSTPIIMLTGWGKALDCEQVRRQGVDYLLAKPCEAQQLLKVIEQALAAARKQWFNCALNAA